MGDNDRFQKATVLALIRKKGMGTFSVSFLRTPQPKSPTFDFASTLR